MPPPPNCAQFGGNSVVGRTVRQSAAAGAQGIGLVLF
ncbi:hypothetical protein XVE_1814 [Xanthomonas vesicatoria ATCC 35937]|uniref:Uncharacterized protein n=1 Tax=Xanthomonas vesicatoria ATCC 35937 TaxID=925775 RepID=F0BCI6_9XANT|nr:hypothetical protein XVE_1814 [Xanthomonas vesicatoria ATCC 35937]